MARKRINVIIPPVPENIDTDSVPDVLPETVVPLEPVEEKVVVPAPVASNPPPRE
jgi:hypothetical protein